MSEVEENLVNDLSVQAPFLTKDEWAGYMRMNPQDQADTLRAFQLGAVPAGVDVLELAIAIMKGTLEVAGAVTGLTGAIAGIQAVLAKK
jgi:hypothetical protein